MPAFWVLLQNVARSHLRLLISVLAGTAATVLLPPTWPLVVRLLLGWNGGVGLFLVLIWTWMMRLNPEQMKARYKDEDEAAWIILLVLCIAALISQVAIVDLLATIKHVDPERRGLHIGLATITIINSWLLLPVMFALHYADMFYSEEKENPPLLFPRTEEPTFWDFLYFSFTIAVACQTADVATAGGPIRKVVTAHAVLSFVFNLSILGFAINVSAGVVGGG
jgi:uncharacterized membrane protein